MIHMGDLIAATVPSAFKTVCLSGFTGSMRHDTDATRKLHFAVSSWARKNEPRSLATDPADGRQVTYR